MKKAIDNTGCSQIFLLSNTQRSCVNLHMKDHHFALNIINNKIAAYVGFIHRIRRLWNHLVIIINIIAEKNHRKSFTESQFKFYSTCAKVITTWYRVRVFSVFNF